MSKCSQNRSTILPLPSSPHCAPRIMTLLMAKPDYCSAWGESAPVNSAILLLGGWSSLVLRCEHAALRGVSEARRGGFYTIGSRDFPGKVENVSALRCVQDAHASGKAQHRASPQSHPAFVGTYPGER